MTRASPSQLRGRPARRALHVIAVIIATAVAVLSLGATAASAHAELTATSPSGGSQLTTSPQDVSVTFGESVDFGTNAIRLFDASGHQLDTGAASHPGGDASTITVKAPALSPGTYVVAWRAISADAHPVQGAFTFRVGNAAAVDTASLATRLLASSGASRAVGFLFGLARMFVFAGLALLIGGAFASRWVWPAASGTPRGRRLVTGAIVVLLAATIASIGLQGAYANGGAIGDVLHVARWREVLATRYGRLAVVRVALTLLAAALVRHVGKRLDPIDDTASRRKATDGPATVRAAALLAIGLVATITLAGHPTTGRWRSLAIPSDLVHVLAMSAWLGGLAVVLVVVLPLASDGEAASAIHRFSRLAAASVGALVVTGAFQSWRQVGHLSALNTDYGRALTWKLRLVVVMVAAAALSRTAVRQGLAPTAPPDVADDVADDGHGDAEMFVATVRRRLRATVLVEVVLAVGVLAVTAALVTTRPAYEVAGGPVTVTMVDRDTVTTLTIDPARAGRNEIHVYVNLAGGALKQVSSLTVDASLPGRNIGPLSIAVDRSGPNHFTASAAELPIAGRWQLTVRARVSEFDERSFTTTVTVR